MSPNNASNNQLSVPALAFFGWWVGIPAALILMVCMAFGLLVYLLQDKALFQWGLVIALLLLLIGTLLIVVLIILLRYRLINAEYSNAALAAKEAETSKRWFAQREEEKATFSM